MADFKMRQWLDTLYVEAAEDPRVVAVAFARASNAWPGPDYSRHRVDVLRDRLQGGCGITATEDQAHALLAAVAEYDGPTGRSETSLRARLTAAVTAIVGKQP